MTSRRRTSPKPRDDAARSRQETRNDPPRRERARDDPRPRGRRSQPRAQQDDRQASPEARVEPAPPSADHVVAVYHLLPRRHRLALLWLDGSGARVASIDETLVSDYDEPRRRVRFRAAASKGPGNLGRPAGVLADAIEAEDRTEGRPRPERAHLRPVRAPTLLRTSIAKSCKAAGVPLWSPHDLRHRRISLLHLRGMPWARIGEFVGQRDLSVTADAYTHAMIDETGWPRTARADQVPGAADSGRQS